MKFNISLCIILTNQLFDPKNRFIGKNQFSIETLHFHFFTRGNDDDIMIYNRQLYGNLHVMRMCVSYANNTVCL